MSKALSWRGGWRYCQGQNSRGYPCGVKVPKGVRYCRYHRSNVGGHGSGGGTRLEPRGRGSLPPRAELRAYGVDV